MRLRKYIAFAGMAVLMLCSCNEMENAPTNKFTDNSYWTSTTKAVCGEHGLQPDVQCRPYVER